MQPFMFNIVDYGAVGDGQTKNTEAIQQTIDVCNEAGGGKVCIPAGTYVSGTIYLKSNVELHLSSGATLLGSSDREDYNADDIFPENVVFTKENVTGAHLIIAYEQENVSITGLGTINGNADQFFGPLEENKVSSYRYKSGNFIVNDWRPGQMVFFCRSKRITVKDVHLMDSTYWNLFLLGCEDVHIRGLTIENDSATPNGDGIDIDCSRNVLVSDCIIRSGDDCITIRANKQALGVNAQPSENVTITNCTLSSPTCAFRIGVGDGMIRNCVMNNIVIPEARTAVNINCRYSTRSSHGATIEQVHFSNIIADVIMPFVVTAGPGAASPAKISDISFSRMRITASAGSQFVGTESVFLQNIRLEDIDWSIKGGSNNCEYVNAVPQEFSVFGYRGTDGLPALPCALYAVFVKNIMFNHVRIRWDEPSKVWRDGLFIKHSEDVHLQSSMLRQPQDGYGTAVHCQQCNGINVYSCIASEGTYVFLKTENSVKDSFIYFMGNNLIHTKIPFETDLPVMTNM